MRTWLDPTRDGYVVEFEPRDVAERLSAEECARFVRPLLVTRRDAVEAMHRGSLRDEQADRVYEHLAAAERHATCYRPGGFDANGAPV